MFTSIVLAGGRSSRMGRPKALLTFDGQPLIVHVVSLLRSMGSQVVVVAAPDQDLPPLPATLVHDEVSFQGPVGGLCYGLAAAVTDLSFVTSCDSVFLNPALIRHLLDSVAGYDVAVPHWQGRFQPLHAVYRRSVLPRLEEQLAQGDLRPVHLFDKVRTKTIDEEEIRGIDPEGASFFNMNTPEDYEEALKRWPQRQSAGAPADVTCTVELFGAAQLAAQTREVVLGLGTGATLEHVYAELARRLPVLVGRVIDPGRLRLLEGYACNVNGLDFVRGASTPVNPGDRIVILAADAGG